MLSFSKTIQHETCSVTKAAVSSYSIAGYIITYIQYSISETEICYCRFMTQGVHVWEATTTSRYPLHQNESVVLCLAVRYLLNPYEVCMGWAQYFVIATNEVHCFYLA